METNSFWLYVNKGNVQGSSLLIMSLLGSVQSLQDETAVPFTVNRSKPFFFIKVVLLA